VGEAADVVFRVFELAAPEQCVVRADLDADPAVHAQGVVDGEAIEHVALPLTTSLALRRKGLLV
jgi:hypothetical protein